MVGEVHRPIGCVHFGLSFEVGTLSKEENLVQVLEPQMESQCKEKHMNDRGACGSEAYKRCLVFS